MDQGPRKGWALFLLVVWLPVYLVAAWWVLNWVYDRGGRLPMWVELPLYVALAFLWAIPFRKVFHGTGK